MSNPSSARPATPPETTTQDSRLVIDEEGNSQSRHSNGLFQDSQVSTESIRRPISPNEEDLGDPQRIQSDIYNLGDDVDGKHRSILNKLNHRGSQNTLKIDNLYDQVGRKVTSREYFLNGQPEPFKYDDDQTISENVLALRNVTRHNRVSIDCLAHKLNRDLKKLKGKTEPDSPALTSTSTESTSSTISHSSSLNAVPNADWKRLKEEVATALAKVTSLSKGNAFNTMDVEERVKTLEKEYLELAKKFTVISKSVNLLKNGHGQSTATENVLPIGINRFDERLLKLEEVAFHQSSKNLFDTSMETTMDLLSKEVQDLKKDLKLNLAGSEMNTWLDTKMKAFLDTPVFMERVNREFKNLLVNYQITPRNLPQDTRRKIVEVNYIF